jgi:hypothetical protein
MEVRFYDVEFISNICVCTLQKQITWARTALFSTTFLSSAKSMPVPLLVQWSLFLLLKSLMLSQLVFMGDFR